MSDATEADHNALIIAALAAPDQRFVNGFPFPADDTAPAATSDEEPPVDFDGGTREPAPPPSDPEAEHGSWLFDAIEKYGEGERDE